MYNRQYIYFTHVYNNHRQGASCLVLYVQRCRAVDISREPLLRTKRRRSLSAYALYLFFSLAIAHLIVLYL